MLIASICLLVFVTVVYYGGGLFVAKQDEQLQNITSERTKQLVTNDFEQNTKIQYMYTKELINEEGQKLLAEYYVTNDESVGFSNGTDTFTYYPGKNIVNVNGVACYKYSHDLENPYKQISDDPNCDKVKANESSLEEIINQYDQVIHTAS